MRKDFLNSNGLVDGRIPKGHACPFYQECGCRVEPTQTTIGCPTEDKPRENDFSCASARGFSIVINSKE